MELVVIRTFENYFLANITLTKLLDAGVNCWLKDENTVTLDPILTSAIGGIKLVVKDTDVAEANSLLMQFDDEYLKAIKCNRCGAAEISLINKPGPTNFFTAILTWLIASYAVAPEKIYTCNKCGWESKTMPINTNENDLHE